MNLEEIRIKNVYARRGADARYSVFNDGHLFMTQERERRVLKLLRRHGFAELGVRKILDVGCGTGQWLFDFVKWGARPHHVAGIDLVEQRVATARNRCPAGVQIQCASAANLPFANNSFDVVVQSLVFTSILDSKLRHAVATEMVRVAKPRGLILWYDFSVDNPRNLDVAGVRDAEIRKLFSGCRIELETLTLVPPVVRLLAPYSWVACHVLSAIPWLCTHYLGAIVKQ